MERMGNKKFKPEVCVSCGQTMEYPVRLGKGAGLIVIAIANAVRAKGENRVHLRKEMLCGTREFGSYLEAARAGRMTMLMINNVLVAKYHGLVAQVRDRAGEYLLTPKGARFLRGEGVPALAVVDKRTHTKKGYIDEATDRVTIQELLRSDAPFWEHEWEIDETTLGLRRKVTEKAMTPLPL